MPQIQQKLYLACRMCLDLFTTILIYFVAHGFVDIILDLYLGQPIQYDLGMCEGDKHILFDILPYRHRRLL